MSSKPATRDIGGGGCVNARHGPRNRVEIVTWTWEDRLVDDDWLRALSRRRSRGGIRGESLLTGTGAVTRQGRRFSRHGAEVPAPDASSGATGRS
ncbi:MULTISPECIES: hypothetical protein [unclassified Nocardiopsis]|uniref:hypothetical protein n=1 Tax=unclassified Nocardiopsis TaxID=2649073 RepID=UPI00135787C8|nr:MULTISPECIES: hypothetical protein [unclassified Nocardiopsis]